MDIVIDVVFVIAITAFCKQQLGLQGRAVLVVAFMIALVFGFAPLIAGLFPQTGAWIKVLMDTVVLFLAAAGSYDAIMDFRYKSIK